MWLSCTQYFHLFTESFVESLLLASPSLSPQLYIYISILLHVPVSSINAALLHHLIFWRHTYSTTINHQPSPTLTQLSHSLSISVTPCAPHLPLLLASSVSIFPFDSQIISLLTIVLMMNLVSFETPPLGRKERANTTITAKASARANESSSSSTCFHSHLDLSLGISLSHGSGSCDATGCSGIKASCGGRQGSGGDKNLGSMTSGTTTTTTTTNVLTAGHCHVSDSTAGGGWAAAFMPSPTGFMHPWSLAARQQKAAAEQKLTPPATYVPSDARVVPLSSAIGWPPVHTSRRNIVTAMHVTKTGGATVAADGPKGSTTTHAGGEKNAAAPTDSTVVATRPPANMFAKVHMDGCTIGRKINLRAHGSYESLSRVLTKITRNFFCPADCSGANTGEEDLPNSDKFIFVYEDFEGDRMLVGDVPWELFLASAKRLYIVQNPASRDKGHGECDGKDKTEEPPRNN
ncbi:hypothetical protein GQ55_8G118700 [Panicum hallii var. hallii]|uniref:Auxin-responsive protein n=1 Tax=Panicum hallii var. hallii TaxID=1504633 RepID=A0A2T7CMQ7_9POAL|nr:hypothetical protein GQ55_8G118700 [Panicum hallii var. hallii]